MNGTISIIIPTYKPKDYLWECLDSLQSQSFPKDSFEIILVLNGCCQPWKNQIEEYLSNSSDGLNLKFVQTDTPGVSNARNIGLDLAQGEYIAFIDDDDFVSPTYLAELYNKAEKDTISLSYPFAFVDGKDKNFKPSRISETYEKLEGKGKVSFYKAKSYFSGPCMKLIHRDIIDGRRFDTRLSVGEDTTFMFVISNRIKSVDFTSRNAIYYRRFRVGSAIKTKRSFAGRLKSNSIQLFIYTKYYLKGIKRYNLYFYLTRCGGCFRGIFNWH